MESANPLPEPPRPCYPDRESLLRRIAEALAKVRHGEIVITVQDGRAVRLKVAETEQL